MREMISEFQLRGLEKLLNSGVIQDIYPMVDNIRLSIPEDTNPNYKGLNNLNIDIILNDPTFNKANMYQREFDPHYLVDYHIRKLYFPYFNIEKVITNFIVWGPDGKIIDSYKY
jgi:hypothetical protein